MENRCGWAGEEAIYQAYHDDEWGVPDFDARSLWEQLVLEGFQAGLSWITILKKREGFRAAFQGFDPAVISGWGENEVQHLLQNPGIVRHRGKIEAREGFVRFLWKYVDFAPLQNRRQNLSDIPAQTDLSKQLSKDLKKAGFRFCGPTTVYAFMQAAGLVNDHLVDCPCHARVRDAPAWSAAPG